MSDITTSYRSLRILLVCTITLLTCSVAAAVDAREQATRSLLPAPAAPPAEPMGVELPAPAPPPEPVSSPLAIAALSAPTPQGAPASSAAPSAAPHMAEPPAAAAAPPEPQASPLERVQAAYEASVPAAWRAALPARLEIVAGSTSWANPDGSIQVSASHAEGRLSTLHATVAHEFGHLIAFRYGSQAFNGAAPADWPAYSSSPEEAWADCVSLVFTGVDAPSHGLPSCGGASLDWSAGWLAQDPGSHPITG